MYSLPTDPTSRALIDQKAQISTDSMIGDSTRVEERTSIKKSVIGRHCIVGKATKITGCVILDHCVIGDGYVSTHLNSLRSWCIHVHSAKLEDCILGKNTKVGSKAELVKCVTQAGYELGVGEL
jgi:translation initiation factor eIF-2B subunit gamma